ncbi:uncharacterized protein LOC143193614 [Rhynchophorus ferrugineus]|uniref:RIIa domain-containing protein n=1 Tax=Rhynchophorus ferrugineus TaxID=354439 RepID=A0A834MLM2_RHYFE|nr:hypothetical protein GWI33_002555 [Rhynchophorus ferrugineus]
MANDTKNIIDPFDFNSTDAPKGMEIYNMEYLTRDQQNSLNHHKAETIRENNKYLFEHPEIQAILQIIIRKLLIERPSHDIEMFISKYFLENYEEIENKVDTHIKSLPVRPKPKLSKSGIKEEKHVVLDETRYDLYSETSRESIADEPSVKSICKELLDKIIEDVMDEETRTRLSDVAEAIEESVSKKSSDDDDDVYLDLGLDFDIDFTAYHDEDD